MKNSIRQEINQGIEDFNHYEEVNNQDMIEYNNKEAEIDAIIEDYEYIEGEVAREANHQKFMVAMEEWRAMS